ncbi:hypothetical protein FACS1894211_11870 [Clostridia bacterium]|nr:hypothetical protein FACS1894211_11870 [Clostridia bacterium]
MFWKKKEGDEAVLRDREIVEENVKRLDVVAAWLEALPNAAARVKALTEAYRYVSPFGTDAAHKADSKIADRIDDMKLAAQKAVKNGETTEIDELIQRIKILIREREL